MLFRSTLYVTVVFSHVLYDISGYLPRRMTHLCIFIDDGTASESTVTGRAIRERQEQTSSAAMTAGQAETVLNVMEQESKLR